MLNNIDESQMHIEGNRLASFRSWPASAPVSPQSLAKAGFYHTGNADEVKCFKCNVRVLCWEQGDDPMTEHRRHFPSCPFLADPNEAGNVQLDSGTVYSSITSSNDIPSTINQMSRMNIQRHVPITSPDLSRGAVTGKQALMGGPCTGSSYAFHGSNTPYNREEMRHEQKRLDSLQIWPKRDKVDPSLVAKAGLFYTGQGDKVKCAFCNGAMMNWDSGDDPAEEHSKYFGDRCPMAKGEPTDNVPLSPNSSAGRNPFDLLNIVTERPKHPEYAILAVRETTFRNWPKEDVQPAKKLSTAGFYYTGEGDNVKCFFCGGSMKNWSKEDDPWIEHAKWFENCGFVRQMKGLEFIHEIKRLKAMKKPSQPKPQEENFDKRQVAAAMALPITRIVLDMGFSEDLIRLVIERKLRNTGENYRSAEDLLHAVLERPESSGSPLPSASILGGSSQRSSTSAPAPLETQMMQNEVAKSVLEEEPIEDDEPMDQEPSEGTCGQFYLTKAQKRRLRRKKKQALTKQAEEIKQAAAEAEKLAPASGATDLPLSDEDKRKLLNENQQLRDQRMCKICMDKDCSMVFLPCGHMCACEECADKLKKCPICNGVIRGTVKAFLA